MRPSVAAVYTPAHRRTTGGSSQPRIVFGPGAQAVVEGLLDGEVERLVVDVGVADGEAAAGPLDEQQLHRPLEPSPVGAVGSEARPGRSNAG